MTDGDWYPRDQRDERRQAQYRGQADGYEDGYSDGYPDHGFLPDQGYREPRSSRRRRRNVAEHDYQNYDYTPREQKHPRLRAWAPLVVLLAILGVFGGAVYAGYTTLKSKQQPVADFTNKVCTDQSPRANVEVPEGATQTEIGQLLADAGVVESSTAYVDAANANQASDGVRAGQYSLCTGIAGTQAVLELLKSTNLSSDSSIEVRSHEWTSEIVAELAAKHKWSVAEVQQVIDDNRIGLPSWAKTADKKWTAEGLLEPGTYQLASTDTPKSVLSAMVKARTDWLASINFEAKAKALTCGTAPCTPEQVITIASIAESEVNQATPDGQEVSEAILSHLKNGDTLKIDSTAMYYVQSRKPPKTGEVSDPKNPYSTYAHAGLPPGPVAIPSRDMIQAVLNPTHSGEYYWCSKNGGTRFYDKNHFADQAAYCAS